uniref:Uncharacterized protein n=1 Tax=Oryza punctata TaxID=4537 RepID=A0A0E0JWJ7_ORYPU
MATVAGSFGSPPPLPLPRLRRRATFSAGARRSAARGRITRFLCFFPSLWKPLLIGSGFQDRALPGGIFSNCLRNCEIAHLIILTNTNSSRNFSRMDSCAARASVSGAEPSAAAGAGGGEDASEIIDAMEVKSSSTAASFLAKVALALGVAATATVISLFMRQPSSGPSFSLPQIIDASAPPDAAATIGYTFPLFGKKVIVPEYTPGQTRASEDISSKIGIGKEKALSISRAVQKYGNLIGFVERFSVGVRNPTGFLAGALGIPADCYFAGVCCGCLFTLPIQLAVGFFLRERPVFALASVAAAVGIWTVFPYAAAACTALFFYLSRRNSSN